MLTKEKIHDLIDHLPENFSLDDIVERIILLQKIDIARQQIKDGDFLTQEEFSKEMDKWD